MDNFDTYNVSLAIATNIPLPLKTGFVAPGHILQFLKALCAVLKVCQETKS